MPRLPVDLPVPSPAPGGDRGSVQEIGGVVQQIIISHSVKDKAVWKRGHDDRVALFAKAGGKLLTEYLATDENTVAFTAEIPDIALVGQLAQEPDVQALMEAHGVVPPLTVLAAD